MEKKKVEDKKTVNARDQKELVSDGENEQIWQKEIRAGRKARKEI